MAHAGWVDAHHHLWRYSPEEFGWLDEPLGALRRDFGVAEMQREMVAAGVKAAVAVQARQSLEENEFLLAAARESRGGPVEIQGVVGWVALCEAGVAAEMERLTAEPVFKGVRHVVQGEPAGFLLREDFNWGVAELGRFGLRYDVLIRADQVEEATVFADRHPRQAMVVDHLAKPAIAAGVGDARFGVWARAIRELARREHVWCKVSGMVTEADWAGWTVEGLRPYFEVVLEAFGVDRLMWGSDWPVVTVASGYGRWVEAARELMGGLSEAEVGRVGAGSAVAFYGLQVGV